MRRIVLAIGLALFAGRAAAETGEVRVGMQYGLQYLPLLVMQHEGLIERHVQAAGLPRPKVSWFTFSGGDLLVQAILANQVDVSNGSLIGFLTLWSKTRGQLDVRSLAAFNRVPVVLLTRNPKVKSIKDFTSTDRIALPAVRSSGQALLLQMEAEKVFGPGRWNELDHLTISRALPDGYAALMDDTNEINSHFSNPPYIELALKKPGVHAILSERDVLGGDTYSGGVSFAARKFVEDNPKTARAYYDAMVEAMQLIKRDKVAAAKMYLALSPQDKTPLDNIVAQVSSDKLVFDVTPLNVMKFAAFMHHIGQIKEQPAGWKDLFFPYVYELSGS